MRKCGYHSCKLLTSSQVPTVIIGPSGSRGTYQHSRSPETLYNPPTLAM
jgi:hypothetical protein